MNASWLRVQRRCLSGYTAVILAGLLHPQCASNPHRPTAPPGASVFDAGSEAAAEAALAAKDAAEQARVAAVASQSVAEAAQAQEGNRGREGTVYIPLRQALDRAWQAADDIDAEALETATHEVLSRFNAIFYLSTVR